MDLKKQIFIRLLSFILAFTILFSDISAYAASEIVQEESEQEEIDEEESSQDELEKDDQVSEEATLEEETTATSKEAACWTKLKRNNVTYPETKLTKRLDKIAGLHVASVRDGNNYIGDKIASSSFYRAQFNL